MTDGNCTQVDQATNNKYYENKKFSFKKTLFLGGLISLGLMSLSGFAGAQVLISEVPADLVQPAFGVLDYLEVVGVPVAAIVLAIILIIMSVKWRRTSKSGTGGFSTNQLAVFYILILLEAATLGYVVYLATVGWEPVAWGSYFTKGNWLFHIILPALSLILLLVATFLALHWRRRGKFVIIAGQTFDWRMPVVIIMLAVSVCFFTYAFSTVGFDDWIEEVKVIEQIPK